MMRSLKNIQGYTMGAQDGNIGRCHDFLIDDLDWAVRYVVADTMKKWLPDRKVLISPIAIGTAEPADRKLNVGLTKGQINDSPPLDATAPVSRQYEIAYNRYYDWGHYWFGSAVWGAHRYPRLLQRSQHRWKDNEKEKKRSKLRSAREVFGYRIQAKDANLGHLDDLIVDMETWTVRYLVVVTRNWVPAVKKMLVKPTRIERVDGHCREIRLNLHSGQIENYLDFDPNPPANREHGATLHDFHGRSSP